MLEKKEYIFSSSYKELFGQSFRDDCCSTLNEKQIYQDILRKETKPSTLMGEKEPFLRNPPTPNIQIPFLKWQK